MIPAMTNEKCNMANGKWSSLNADHRLEPRDFAREPRPVGRVNHRADVFVSAWRLFGHATHRGAADDYSAAGQVIDHLAAFPLLQRLMAAHGAARAVTRRAERTLFALAGPGQDVRRRAHRAADQHRLARFFVDLRQVGMAGAEGARRAFAMHEEPATAAARIVLFDLAGVV